MLFVSLVGTQIMAVFNPILSLEKGPYRIGEVYLLSTPQVQGQSNRLKQLLDGRRIRCYIIPIAKELNEDKQGNHSVMPVIKEIYKRTKQNMIFNIAGGMNFLVSACILALEGNPYYWIYPESNGVHLFEVKKGKTTFIKTFALPSPVDVLRFQGVEYTEDRSNKHGPHFILKKVIPNLQRLTYYSIWVSDVFFDFVFNNGNELRFLKVIHHNKGKESKSSDKYLAEVRGIISIAVSRHLLGELYHRGIGILTNHPMIVERLRLEASNKVKVFDYSHCRPEQLTPQVWEFLGFGYGNQDLIKKVTGRKIVISNKKGKRHLVTVLGRDILPTLTALSSHAPDSVTLIYTPQDETVNRYIKNLTDKEKVRLLGLNSIELWPVSFRGEKIMDIPCPSGIQVEVNITPGTKIQCAMLTKWAMENGADVFSINTMNRSISSLRDKTERGVKGFSLDKFLRIAIPNIKKYEDINDFDEQRKRVLKGILTFLKELKGNLQGFPYRSIKIGNAEFKRGKKAKILGNLDDLLEVISWEEKEWKEGRLVENLVAFRLKQNGFEDIKIRVETGMSKQTERFIKEKYNREYKDKDPHLTELDVVASRGARYFVISCKSNIKDIETDDEWQRLSREVEAMAKLFGRFTIPLLFVFNYDGEPDMIEKVYRFGWKTLIDDERLEKLLLSASNSRKL